MIRFLLVSSFTLAICCMDEKSRFSKYQSANDTTSQSLVNAMLNGEEEAWEKIALIWGPTLHAFFRGKGLQVADAEEVSQNVLVKMFGAMSRSKFVRDGKSKKLKHFVYHIASNELRTFYKKFHNKPKSPGGSVHQEQLANLGEDDDSVSFEAMLVAQLLDVIKQDFDDSTWKAFCYRYYDNMAFGEISEFLDVTANAARQKVHRVRERLRLELEAALSVEDHS